MKRVPTASLRMSEGRSGDEPKRIWITTVSPRSGALLSLDVISSCFHVMGVLIIKLVVDYYQVGYPKRIK